MTPVTYGALNSVDVQILEEVLSKYSERPLRFLEVGIHVGSTARGIADYCNRNAIGLEYWGVDAVKPDVCPPFPGASFVHGDSAEVFHLVPRGFDIAFIDGCHCRNHVILDTLNYGDRVSHWGYLLFHDCSPEIQQSMRDPHGPNIPQFHNSVLEAHKLMGFPGRQWEHVRSGYEHGHQYGGIDVYRKVRQ